MARERGLVMVDQHMGTTSNVVSGTDMDAPGAKDKVYFLRNRFSLVKRGTDEVVDYPERVISMPRWRAVEMQLGREGNIISDDEALPILARQQLEDEEKARESREAAKALIDRLQIENGTKPSETSEIDDLKAQVAKQNEMLEKLMGMLGGAK